MSVTHVPFAPLSPDRSPRVSVAGQVYHLTALTLFRRPVFRDHEAARAVARLHLEGALWAPSQCLGWVLLPDAWHGLVRLGPGDTLEHLMRRFKAVTTRAVDDRFKTNGWLWGRSFRDHTLRRNEDVRAAARHLAQAPVREGLAASPASWPYWDASWLLPDRG